MTQQHIADLRRQYSHALEHIVQMRLRNACPSSQTPFGQLPTLHAVLYVCNEPKLQQFKIHEVRG